ncbi:hypothetical protein RhiirA1_448795 [Rhizophagus irregularis]|uniref:Uncharacterized protein n=3 Tax=Rhizophagus irregularis TaxID=588596 RepID=A0A2N0SIS6_9GLOM|nr:hypothetical protein RirG_187100 [Rhizophagus irregularis DAOM 197198w]PKC75416.1 hypothetical protein RhiirA1_448795 [Rhizophagus irregularis]GET56303.1 hypothetical protein GLOIN_2v1665801 [Rhizophagus irregularis DAOM 181602=DAOM 197198]CAG8693688.1 8550_t:CDS:2 [Rhizophagus irregularis]
MDGAGNSSNGGQLQLSPELQEVLDSLTPKQRRDYNACILNSKVGVLEMILEDRKKSAHL